ncbi:MAG: hypothetical protein JWN38_1095 [Candidatus Saccharibacteria bacterium]|nr:hypothetical protein [Candidatus Saccharibacteria bacterium]
MIQQTTELNNTQLLQIGQQHMLEGFTKQRQKTLDDELHEAGVDRYDFWLPETHALPYIVHLDEHIKGIVYGKYVQNGTEPAGGRGALVATDSRILLIDKKPMFLKCDELSYHVVSGVTYTKVGMAGTVTLHTRAGDIHVRTFNQKCADMFVAAIEAKTFEGAENLHKV